MAYSPEVLARARRRLEEAREEKDRENREHLAIAYEKVPRIREIDRQLLITMATAAQAAFAGKDAVAIMDRARQENQKLQNERQWLIDTTFEEGFLDERPVCEVCGGSGYVGSTMCECLQELCRQEQKKELTFLNVGHESFDQFRLEYYPGYVDAKLGFSPRAIMEKTFQICKRYAYEFGPKSENLLFSGNTGLGKTFLSACIARKVADSGFSVVYESAGHLFAVLEKAKFENSEESRKAAQKYASCDLLIVDDLGTELPGQFVTAALYTLINDRLLTGKPTIISTNLDMEDLPRRYSPQIASRLRGAYRRVAFVGDDIRLMKNRG